MTTDSPEEWRAVVGYEGLYEVSDRGRVRCIDRLMEPGELFNFGFYPGTILPTIPNRRQGYLAVSLRKRRYVEQWSLRLVHHLVMAAFVGPKPKGLVVCHYDDDPTNNTLANLRYDTQSANLYDAVRNGRNHVANRTHCVNGHEFNEENTRIDGDGRRVCRECRKAIKERRKQRTRTTNEH